MVNTKDTNPLKSASNFAEQLAKHIESKYFEPARLYNTWHGACSYFPTKYASNNFAALGEGDVACNCGCGQELINATLYNMLTHARMIAAVPFHILSWNRCHAFNLVEEGSINSSHLRGLAVDIRITNSVYRFKVLKALLDVGFDRIGIYPWGIHVDLDLNKPAGVCWYE